MTDADAPLATFVHPQGAFSLSYPAHWENQVQQEGRMCGFGPRERDDVGLWISVLPARVDTEHPEMRAGLAKMFQQAAGQGISNIREDRSLAHFSLKADSSEGDAGRFWLVTGGDLILFASTQVPQSARQEFEGPFDRLMASLRVHRDEALARVQLSNDLLRRLRDRLPDQDFHYDSQSPHSMNIRGRDFVIHPGNLFRRVQNEPRRREELIKEFIAGISFSGDDAPSAEDLEAVRDLIIPVLKPADYVSEGAPAATVIHRPWLGQVVICYGIQGQKTLRLILEKDLRRWGATIEDLDRIAHSNLEGRSFPEKLPPADSAGKRVIHFNTGDGCDSARILHPSLHRVFSPVLGSPFLAGIPDRGTLVLFGRGDRTMVAGLAAKIREDYNRAAYPISPETYLVGPRGIEEAPAPR
jgi:uncharacterized protein YtpQ (UPF0354 family)